MRGVWQVGCRPIEMFVVWLEGYFLCRGMGRMQCAVKRPYPLAIFVLPRLWHRGNYDTPKRSMSKGTTSNYDISKRYVLLKVQWITTKFLYTTYWTYFPSGALSYNMLGLSWVRYQWRKVNTQTGIAAAAISCINSLLCWNHVCVD